METLLHLTPLSILLKGFFFYLEGVRTITAKMSLDNSFCERFHLLPEEIASNYIEISSDEDDTARSMTAQELQGL